MYILLNIFFLFSLNPYISLIKYNSDIQPFSYIIGFFLLIFLFNLKKLDFIDIYFGLFALISFFYINPNSQLFFADGYSSAQYGLNRKFAVIFAYIVFYLTRHYLKYFNTNLLFISLAVNILSVFINIYNPEFYNYIAQYLLRDIKLDFSTYVGPRGYSGLCMEPTYLAGFSLTMFVLNEYFYSNNKINKYIYLINISQVFFLLYISKSASALIFLFLILIYLFYKNFLQLKYFFIILVFIIPIGSLFDYENLLTGKIPGHNRAIKLVNKVLSSDDRGNSFISEPSVLRRIVPIIISVQSFQKNIFGSGGGSYPIVAIKNIDKTFNFLSIDKKYYKYYSLKNNKKIPVYIVKNPSAFSLYLTEFGIFFLIFLIFVYIKSKKNILLLCSSFILLLASFSFITSFIWIMVGILNLKYRDEKQII